MYYKACTKHILVLLCTVQLAQSVPQYYFVLPRLHQALPSRTVYYELTQGNSQHSFLLLVSTSTKLAQHYLTPRSLHKVPFSTRKIASQLPLLIEGSLEAKFPTIWTYGKDSQEEAQRWEKIRKGESQKREDASTRKGSGGSKSRLAKAAGAETSGQMRNEKLHPGV